MAIASYKRSSLWQTKFHGRNCRHQPFYPINLKKGATRGLEWMQIAQVGAINLKRFSLAVWLSAVRHLFVLTILSPANCKLQTRPPLPPEFPNIHCHIHIYFFFWTFAMTICCSIELARIAGSPARGSILLTLSAAAHLLTCPSALLCISLTAFSIHVHVPLTKSFSVCVTAVWRGHEVGQACGNWQQWG